MRLLAANGADGAGNSKSLLEGFPDMLLDAGSKRTWELQYVQFQVVIVDFLV
jgi:hypothetical protein